MKRADSSAFGIDKKDGQAIGGLNGKQQAGSVGEEAVADDLGSGWRVNGVNNIRVNLAKGDQGPRLAGFPAAFSRLRVIGGKRPQERQPIAFDSSFGIVFGKS